MAKKSGKFPKGALAQTRKDLAGTIPLPQRGGVALGISKRKLTERAPLSGGD